MAPSPDEREDRWKSDRWVLGIVMDIIENNSNQPLVSVIIPAFNAERYIAKTLDSVLHQTYRNIEVLVVDDGSQDKTAEIIESICHHDHRVYPLYLYLFY